jgi:hypothetical protein
MGCVPPIYQSIIVREEAINESINTIQKNTFIVVSLLIFKYLKVSKIINLLKVMLFY